MKWLIANPVVGRALLVGAAAAGSHVVGELPPEWVALLLGVLGVSPAVGPR